MDADHLSAAQAVLSGDIVARSGQPLRTAIEGLSPACPIAKHLADSASRHADRALELRSLRKAKESLAATVARESGLLKLASPVQEDLIRLVAYRDPVIFQIEALELAHAREFRSDVRLAMQLAARRRNEVQHVELPELPNHLKTDKKCEAYLRLWQENRGVGCPACGARSAYFIAERAIHECDSCGHQSSVREDTLFRGSHVPLRKWFSAIYALLLFPNATSKLLAKHLRISRIDTVRKMRSRILEAVSLKERSILLAGLDSEFALQCPERNAPHSALGSAREIGGLGRT